MIGTAQHPESGLDTAYRHFANSYGIRWQGFVQTLQAVVQFRKALLWYVLEPVYLESEIILKHKKEKC